MNLLSHTGHLWGLSPLWMRRWVLRELEVEKAFPHTSHSNGFSPVGSSVERIKNILSERL